MPILQCYVDDKTFCRLQHAARDLGRSIESLAESSIEETALNDAKARYSNGERADELGFGK